jgi:uncharacterized protein with WD repeat
VSKRTGQCRPCRLPFPAPPSSLRTAATSRREWAATKWLLGTWRRFRKRYFLRTFDVVTRAAGKTIPGSTVHEPYSHFVLSPDGQILAAGLANGTITFSDAKTGAVMATIAHAYASNVFQLAFSPNGKHLATTGISDEADLKALAPKIWDTATHKLVAAPLGHTDLVIAVAFSPDGKTLATSSADNSIRFWDTTTWKEIPPSLGQKEAVIALAFSPKRKNSCYSLQGWDDETLERCHPPRASLPQAWHLWVQNRFLPRRPNVSRLG